MRDVNGLPQPHAQASASGVCNAYPLQLCNVSCVAHARRACGWFEDEGLPTEHEETPTARKSANSLIPSLGRVLKDALRVTEGFAANVCSDCSSLDGFCEEHALLRQYYVQVRVTAVNRMLPRLPGLPMLVRRRRISTSRSSLYPL